MIPDTNERVTINASEESNRLIREQTIARIQALSHSSRADINRRLEELDREWDIERTLEANASTLALTGCILSMVRDRRWIILPVAVTSFLLQHAVQGWCPPLPILRKLGFRTEGEINHERQALKILRGDFDRLTNANVKENAQAVYAAVGR